MFKMLFHRISGNILFLLLVAGILNVSCEMKKSRAFDCKEIKSVLTKVADWQIEHFTYLKEGNLHDYGIDAWTNGVLYLGMADWAEIAPDSSGYYNWLLNIGNENEWKVPANFLNHPKYGIYHSDELSVTQYYLRMYQLFGYPEMLDATKARIDTIMANPPDPSMNYRSKQSWTWCDALFMAPPVYAQLYQITGERKYIDYLDAHFKKTWEHLYDKEQKLFFRDDSYFEKKEQNGESIFWGRGNGWVVAGLANLLKYLPEQDKGFYEKLFIELTERLIELQDENGYWHASLLDPDSYPAPEASATALIAYAVAYGINTGLLEQEEYIPALKKSWKWLISVIDENGKLGWVQPIGADPKKVTADMTAVYGVGALLMAGTEICKMDR